MVFGRGAERSTKKAAKAGAKQFSKLPLDDRRIVVYAEGRHDWPHLGPIVDALVSTHQRRVTYLTSEVDDPILSDAPDGVTALFVGIGMVRNMLFRSMAARVVIMTLPDLDQLELKRSATVGRYVYVFHALVSTHMVYREGSFDDYDTILTVGPHHDAEIRAREAQEGLPAKRLIPHGYGRLDTLLAAADAAGGTDVVDPRHVLIAGSWGPDALMENPAGIEACERLLARDFRVTVRLHPMSRRHHPELVDQLRDRFSAHGDNFVVETDLSDSTSLRTSAVMISDWSGASFDYAFGELRPVVYIDMPAKVNNPNWEALGIEPIERAVRHEIGAVVSPDRLDELPDRVQALAAAPDEARDRLIALREASLHHVGNSAAVAAEWISGETN